MVLQSWLDLVCQMLPKVKGAILMTELDAERKQSPAALWPQELTDYADLQSAIPLAAKRNSPVFSLQQSKPDANSPASMLVAQPLQLNNQLFGVLALELEADFAQQQVVGQLLQWAQAWLQLLLRQQQEQPDDNNGITLALEAGLKFERTQDAMTAAASQLARALDCERVSVGLLKHDQIKLCGLSHSAIFDRRVRLIRNIEAAMEETCQQGSSICFPASTFAKNETKDNHHPAHQHLSKSGEQAFLCSLPLMHQDECLGAVMFERNSSPFAESDIIDCEAAANILASLALIKDRHKSSSRSFYDKVKIKTEQLFGAGHLKLKITAAVSAFFCLLLIFGEMQYRVRAPALLEGSIQRAVVAPFEGYVANAFARAGETIKAGEPIADLDDRELKLEHRRWLGQKDEFVKQYRKALADLDYVQAKIFKAQITQADAQLSMLEENIGRAHMVAPLDGIIISGDLSRALGAAVEKGQVLFEVAPLDEYRLVLLVDEREIRELAVGQQGTLSLSALPGEDIDFEVERIATVFQEQDDRIIYRTEAKLDSNASLLRPGMQGVGKIIIEERSIGWILFHRLFDWIRFELWSWLP